MFFEKTEKCFWSVKHCNHINLGREERSKRIFGQERVSDFANLAIHGLIQVYKISIRKRQNPPHQQPYSLLI